MRKNWLLEQSSFDRLLDWLDPDREQAGLRYEMIRSKLITIFQRRGCEFAEDLADETINRVISKINWLSQSYEGDPALYFYGVAKHIVREAMNHSTNPIILPSPDPPEQKEKEEACLNHCLQSLPPKSRELFSKYFLAERAEQKSFRIELANQLGIPLNTLRMRIHRIREALQKCVRDCMEDN